MKKAKAHNSIIITILRWLVCLVILAAVLWYGYLYTGRLLCSIAISRLGELTHTRISAGSIVYQANGTVFIKDFTVKPLVTQSSGSDILMAKKVSVSFDKASLFLFNPILKTIDVNEFAFNVIYDVNSGWSNLSDFKLKPPKGSFSKVPKAPNINLRSGNIQYSKIINGNKETVLSVPVEADFSSDKQQPQKYNFNVTTATMSSGYGQSQLKGYWQPGTVIFTGGIASLSVPDFRLACLIDVMAAELKYDEEENYTMVLSIKDMKSLRSAEPNGLALDMPRSVKKIGFVTGLQEFFDWYEPKGAVDIRLNISGNLNQLADSKVNGTIKCKDASINYIDFRYAIDHLNGDIDFTQDGLTLNNIKGKHGNTEFSFQGWFRNFGHNEEYSVDIKSDKLPLEDDLYKALSTKEQEFWSAFSPVGNCTVDLHFEKKPHIPYEMLLKLGLLDVNARYHNFPYPLTNLTGRLVFDRQNIKVQDVVSRNSDTEIALNGIILNSKADTPSFNISIGIKDIPLDAALESSLQEDQKKLYRLLAPMGLTSGIINVTGSDSGDTEYIADMDFNDASIKLNSLSSPVSNITAHAVFTHDLIVIRNFSGNYCDIPVSITGQVLPDMDKQLLYDVSVNLQKLNLNDNEFYSFMPEPIKKIINQFNPGGGVNITIDLKKDNRFEPVSYCATVNCINNSVKLKELPYQATDITGSIKIDSDKIILSNISGNLSDNYQNESDRTKIFLKGEIELALNHNSSGLANSEMSRISAGKIMQANTAITDIGDFISRVKLRLSVKNVLFDENFTRLLPEHCQSLYKALAPKGKFDIDFQSIEYFRDSSQLTFDSTVSLGGCNFVIYDKPAKLDSTLRIHGEYVMPSREIAGSVQPIKFATGESAPSLLSVKSNGNTEISGFKNCSIIIGNGTLNILGITISSLKTQISYDPNEQKWISDYLLADVYGGRTIGNLEFRNCDSKKNNSTTLPDPIPAEYVLQAAFDNIDLKRFLSDLPRRDPGTAGETGATSTGKMSGSLNLYSQLALNQNSSGLDSIVSRRGECKITIKNMQIGKMSVLANLLGVLNLNEPSDYAFDSMFIDSYIRRNNLVVEKLDMSGKSVAFYGAGTVNLSDGIVDMSLTARGHRLATDDPSILASFAEGLGQAVVRMDVTGDIHNIKVVTKALPVIEGTLQILGAR